MVGFSTETDPDSALCCVPVASDADIDILSVKQRYRSVCIK